MTYHTCHSWILLSFFSLTCWSFGQQAEIRVQSLFEPDAITLSRQASYKVIIHGSQQSPEGELPRVDGLVISNNPNLLRSASFNNGMASLKLELSFSVHAKQTGMFEMPAWNIVVGGKAYPVPPANLRVFPPNEADVLREQARKKKEADLRQALFLELTLPSGKLYEGQTMIGSVDLYRWEALSMISGRAITVLLVPSYSESTFELPKEDRDRARLQSFRQNVHACYTYSPGGIVQGGDVVVSTASKSIRQWGTSILEANEAGQGGHRKNWEDGFKNEKLTQSFKQISVDEALCYL